MSGSSRRAWVPTRMNLFERLHQARGSDRRIRVLCEHFEPLIPPHATLLDVGCGDGAVTIRLAEQCDDLTATGIDVLPREQALIPVTRFDGFTLPHDDDAFDVVLLSDVLHHSEDPERLLREATRVARTCVLVKDHTLTGPFSGPLLRFMDDVGNRRLGVSRASDYWPEPRWRETFERLGLSVEAWSGRIPLYPPPLSWIFGRSLHFVARLGVPVRSATER